MVVQSPSTKQSIEIRQTALANEFGLQVRLIRPSAVRNLFESRRETVVYFVEVWWTADETKVGIVITGAVTLHLAFDTRSGEQVPFEHVRKTLVESLRRDYSIPPNEDAIAWAALADAQAAFQLRHPEVHLSYRD